MKIGFTGTQAGMTPWQQTRVEALLRKRFTPGSEFHHGDCIGADVQAAGIAKSLGYRVVSHPPIYASKRAFYAHSDEIRPAYDYLVRNHNIVDATESLIATPKEPDEQLRSGTWATVRYARKKNVPIDVIPPRPTP